MSCDLHCHTKLSDGSVGIEELISLAKRRGLHTIAITDHDTFAGAVRGVNIGKRAGVNVIPGAELSAVDPATGRKVHILCYNCASAARLEGLCRRTLESRKKAATEMLRRVMRYYPISPELVVRCATGSAAVYKQHIMHALMDAGFADSIFGEVFDRLFNKENGVAVAAVEYPDVRDVLAQVHEAGGIAVLLTGYLPLGAVLIAALAVPVGWLQYGGEAGALLLFNAGIMLTRHWPGLVRMYRGEEPQFFRPKH